MPVGMIEDIDTLLDKDIKQFEIHVRKIQRTWRIDIHRAAGSPLGGGLGGLRQLGNVRFGLDFSS